MKTYMFIGHGSNNQIKNFGKVKKIIDEIVQDIPLKSKLLYFGDEPNPKAPDIGLVYEYIKEQRPDLYIHMIQNKVAKKYGYPKWVNKVSWHNDVSKACEKIQKPRGKWSGENSNGNPCSNTKKWIEYHNKHGIERCFIFGGGITTLIEARFLRKLEIPYDYYPVMRKYLGDKKTIARDNSVGITRRLSKKKLPI